MKLGLPEYWVPKLTK